MKGTFARRGTTATDKAAANKAPPVLLALSMKRATRARNSAYARRTAVATTTAVRTRRALSKAAACGPLAWSTYAFVRTDATADTDATLTYRQTVGAPTGTTPAGVNWTGNELVAFKLHLPSKVQHHNVRKLSDNTVGEVERGNILTWEQRLTDRLAGTPVEMEVITDADSILYQTMYLFAGAFVAAVIVLITIIWLVIRRGRVRLRELRR